MCLVTGAIFSIMAGAYYWLPKWTGNMYDEGLAKLALLVSLISVERPVLPNALCWFSWVCLVVFLITLLQFADFNKWVSIGGFAFGLSQLLICLSVVLSVFKGGKKPD